MIGSFDHVLELIFEARKPIANHDFRACVIQFHCEVYVQGRGEVHIGFWWGNLRERDNLYESVVDGRIILKWIFKTWDGGHGLD
jgi:hypothetical protein